MYAKVDDFLINQALKMTHSTNGSALINRLLHDFISQNSSSKTEQQPIIKTSSFKKEWLALNETLPIEEPDISEQEIMDLVKEVRAEIHAKIK